MNHLEISEVRISGWQTRFEKDTDKLVLEVVNEERALSDYREHFWIGISEIIKNIELLGPE